jgi:hypothetical protein
VLEVRAGCVRGGNGKREEGGCGRGLARTCIAAAELLACGGLGGCSSVRLPVPVVWCVCVTKRRLHARRGAISCGFRSAPPRRGLAGRGSCGD